MCYYYTLHSVRRFLLFFDCYLLFFRLAQFGPIDAPVKLKQTRWATSDLYQFAKTRVFLKGPSKSGYRNNPVRFDDFYHSLTL